MKTDIKLNFYQIDQVLCIELGTASSLLHHLCNMINCAIAGLSSTQMPVHTLNRTHGQNPHFEMHRLNTKQFLSAFSCFCFILSPYCPDSLQGLCPVIQHPFKCPIPVPSASLHTWVLTFHGTSCPNLCYTLIWSVIVGPNIAQSCTRGLRFRNCGQIGNLALFSGLSGYSDIFLLSLLALTTGLEKRYLL